MSTSAVRIAVLYPEVLGTYGDGGNAMVLERRMAWRRLPVEVVRVSLGDPAPADCDLYVLGGGEDEAQVAALDSLRRSPGLRDAVHRGSPVLAVCAGLQLLGVSFTTSEGRLAAGLDLLDVTTTRRSVRAVGELVATPDPELGLPPLTGFENHGGTTRLGPDARPFATVVAGVGNGDTAGVAGVTSEETHHEGALQAGIIGTYLHGPVLARNPELADLLLSRAMGAPLPPLDDPTLDDTVHWLRAERLARVPSSGRGRRFSRGRNRPIRSVGPAGGPPSP